MSDPETPIDWWDEERQETNGDGQEVQCPLCGKTLDDLWEFGPEDEKIIETDCGWCCKPITIRFSITIDSYCRPREEKEDDNG